MTDGSRKGGVCVAHGIVEATNSSQAQRVKGTDFRDRARQRRGPLGAAAERMRAGTITTAPTPKASDDRAHGREKPRRRARGSAEAATLDG